MKLTILKFLPAILLFTLSVKAQQNTFVKTYGLPGYNYGQQALQTYDGGYIILGNKSGFIGNTDIYLIKTDSAGAIIWDKAIGDYNTEWGNDLKITHDSGYIIAGYSSDTITNDYNALLIKTDSSGNIEWQKTYGGSDWDFAYSVIETPDSGYVITGETYSYGAGNTDVYLVKTNKYGDTLWTKTFGGANEDVAKSIDTCYDDGFIIAGYTKSFGSGEYDGYLIKTNSSGDTLWTKILNDTLDADIKIFCARQTSDTGFIFPYTRDSLGMKGTYLVKTDSSGNILWERDYFASMNEYFDVKESPNGYFIMVGENTGIWSAGKEDGIASITYNNGWWLGSEIFGGTEVDKGSSINLTNDGGCIIAGTTESFGIGLTNIYILKTNDTLYANNSNYIHETIINKQDYDKNNIFSVYPNPTNGKINLFFTINSTSKTKISISDIYGKIIYYKENNLHAGTHTEQIDLNNFSNGVYFISLNTTEQKSTRKIILNKNK